MFTLQLAGRPSWSLHVGGPAGILDHALFVRDAAALPVEATADLPGRLIDPHPRLTRILSDEERQEAGQQWASWWHVCEEMTVLRTLQDGPLVAGVWHEELNTAPARVGEAPRWTALAERPALQKAVLLCHTSHQSWRREQDSGARGPMPDGVEHRVLADLVARLARANGVPPHRLHARVRFVSAAGLWWRRVWPGVVVATREALAEETSHLALVEDGFVSGL